MTWLLMMRPLFLLLLAGVAAMIVWAAVAGGD
jgi:hypothetical protein